MRLQITSILSLFLGNKVVCGGVGLFWVTGTVKIKKKKKESLFLSLQNVLSKIK